MLERALLAASEPGYQQPQGKPIPSRYQHNRGPRVGTQPITELMAQLPPVWEQEPSRGGNRIHQEAAWTYHQPSSSVEDNFKTPRKTRPQGTYVYTGTKVITVKGNISISWDKRTKYGIFPQSYLLV